jgi:hypothetical protein
MDFQRYNQQEIFLMLGVTQKPEHSLLLAGVHLERWGSFHGYRKRGSRVI